MGIMDKMRQRMGIVMIILVLAFAITIVFDWGAGGVDTFMGGRDVVGVVNGEKITLKSFYETYNAALEQYRNAGIDLTAQVTETVLQQTWETAVSQILWAQEIKRLGIKISDEELYFHLENNPPEFLKTQEVFLTDGVFDQSKYIQVLRNPQGNEWLEIENYLRLNVLPYQKLNSIILTSVVVDENEILREFIDRSVTFSVNYLTAPVHLLPDSLFPPKESDVTSYYEANKEARYKQDERRHIRIVSWPKVPSADDTAAVLNDLEDIALRAEEGESFEELAQIFSEIQDSSVTGDLGWLGRSDLRAEYRGPVMMAKAGKILDPIIIGDEFHLLKVTGKRTVNGAEEARLSVLIRRIDPVNTYDYFATEADAFVLDVESYGFVKAFENVAAELDTFRGGFTKEFPYFGDLGYLPALAKWAYRSKAGDLSSVYENEKAFVVGELLEIVPSSYMPLADVRTSVERAVIAEMKKEKSADLVRAAHAAFLRGEIDLKMTAESDPYLEYQSGSFVLNNLPYPLGASPVFADVVRSLSVSDISAPFTVGGYGDMFVQLVAKTPVDEEVYAAERNELKGMLLEEKQRNAYESWMNDLREKAEIKDYRSNFGLN